MSTIPTQEVAIDAALVETLLRAQCPALAELPLTPFRDAGDTLAFRLGETLLVRLPRRARSVPPLEHELRWLPSIGPHLSVATPIAVFVGRPSPDFAWPWCVVPHTPGTAAGDVAPEQRRPAAEALADFFIELHVPAPRGVPENPLRGLSLDQEKFHASASARIDRVPELADALRSRWEAWTSAPEWDYPDLWIHGDPHPMNLILDDDGGLAAVVDWGNITSGDPASDLATAWMTFDAAGREVFRARADLGGWYDEASWTRAKAWALLLGLVFVQRSDDTPALTAVGQHTLAEVLAEPVGA